MMLSRRALGVSQFISARKLPTYAHVRWASTLPKLAIFEAIVGHDPRSPAIVNNNGDIFTYGQLAQDVAKAKERLSKVAGDLDDERVVFLVENGYNYVGATS
jgi:acyl-CoA synthetase (AMP-forming)/AMP-acid ligase II